LFSDKNIKGMHIDPCRHFIPIDLVIRTIELMRDLGFNVLHLHLSDDQAIPFECSKFTPPGEHWSIEDQKRLSEICRSANISIIPEIDIPGHACALLSMLEPGNYQPETRLGVVTTTYIDPSRHLPIIIELYSELAERFCSPAIHIGGDEARTFQGFSGLVTKICNWAERQNLKVIAWDDVLTGWKDSIPDNLIIQRWRYRTSPRIAHVPVILSFGSYLDHCLDPMALAAKPISFGGKFHLGWIACTWTELIDRHNFWNTLIPAVYVLSVRWSAYQRNEAHKIIRKQLPKILYDMCERHGYPEEVDLPSWKTRFWYKFYSTHPRSTSSVDVFTPLNRDSDRLPVFSKSLIMLMYHLYRVCQMGEKLSDNDRDFCCRMIREAVPEITEHDAIQLMSSRTLSSWVKQRSGILKDNVELYGNGVVKVLKYLSRI